MDRTNATRGFMLQRRSRELGTYILIGLENKQVARLFFLENLALGIMSSAVPTTPRTMDRTNATRRPLPVLTTAPSLE